MAQQRLPMRKIRDVLRLSAAGLSKRQIAASLGIGPTAAGACLRRAREAGVGWPVPEDLDDAALERRLYPVPTPMAKDWRSLPDWPAIHRELRRKGVTLQLVWEEYRAAHPDPARLSSVHSHVDARLLTSRKLRSREDMNRPRPLARPPPFGPRGFDAERVTNTAWCISTAMLSPTVSPASTWRTSPARHGRPNAI
jgi:hypothetical protein